MQREELSATVAEDGTLTYGAWSDGSPYSVINQARGTYTKHRNVGRVVRHGQVLYRVNDRPLVRSGGDGRHRRGPRRYRFPTRPATQARVAADTVRTRRRGRRPARQETTVSATSATQNTKLGWFRSCPRAGIWRGGLTPGLPEDGRQRSAPAKPAWRSRMIEPSRPDASRPGPSGPDLSSPTVGSCRSADLVAADISLSCHRISSATASGGSGASRPAALAAYAATARAADRRRDRLRDSPPTSRTDHQSSPQPSSVQPRSGAHQLARRVRFARHNRWPPPSRHDRNAADATGRPERPARSRSGKGKAGDLKDCLTRRAAARTSAHRASARPSPASREGGQS